MPIKPLHIRNITIDPPVILPPMSGVTDYPFRIIARDFGCGFAFFEMVHAISLLNRRSKSLDIVKTSDLDRPIAAQLLGNDPELLVDAANVLLEKGSDFVDLNAACPVRKVVKARCGAYLLRDRLLLARILKRLSSKLKSPITVKLRLGWDDPEDIFNLVKLCEESGVAAVFLHGRTREQGYRGDVRYDYIAKAKENINIPLIASGNVWKAEDVLDIIGITRADGILVARGAIGNPWIFSQAKKLLSGKGYEKFVPIGERIKTVLRHFDLLVSSYGEYRAIHKMRGLARSYLKGIRGISRFSERLHKIGSKEALVAVLDSFVKELEQYYTIHRSK